MKGHAHGSARRRIHRLFTAGLPPRAHRTLLREVRACPRCAALYSRYGALEDALCGGLAAPGPFELEHAEALVLERAVEAAPPARGARARPWSLAAATACALALLLVLLRGPGSERVRLGPEHRLAAVQIVARGAASLRLANVGVRLLRAEPRGSALAETRSLTLSDLITFTYTDADPRARFLAILGVQQDGKIRWYYPWGAERSSVQTLGDRVDEPLGDGFRLSVSHRPGWLRVTAVFSERPLARDALTAAVQALAARPGALEGLDPLPLEGVLEHSMRVEIAPEP